MTLPRPRYTPPPGGGTARPTGATPSPCSRCSEDAGQVAAPLRRGTATAALPPHWGACPSAAQAHRREHYAPRAIQTPSPNIPHLVKETGGWNHPCPRRAAAIEVQGKWEEGGWFLREFRVCKTEVNKTICSASRLAHPSKLRCLRRQMGHQFGPPVPGSAEEDRGGGGEDDPIKAMHCCMLICQFPPPRAMCSAGEWLLFIPFIPRLFVSTQGPQGGYHSNKI